MHTCAFSHMYHAGTYTHMRILTYVSRRYICTHAHSHICITALSPTVYMHAHTHTHTGRGTFYTICWWAVLRPCPGMNKCVDQHIWTRHVTLMNEAWDTYEWVIAYRWIRSSTHINQWCRTYERGMSHIRMSYVTIDNQSCHTYK